jgi:hypothetical protein
MYVVTITSILVYRQCLALRYFTYPAFIGKEAGDCFYRQADMQTRIQERDEAAPTFVAASKCYKKSNPEGIHIEWYDNYPLYDSVDA